MGNEIQATDGKSTKTGKTSKRPRNIEVKILERQGQAVLVEYNLGAGPQRVSVPAGKLKGNDIGSDALEQGVPYGEDWTTWVDEKHGQAFANQLRATQIWTKQDFLARSNEVRAALQRIYVNDQFEEMLKKAARK